MGPVAFSFIRFLQLFPPTMKSRESGYRLLYVFLVAACAFSTLPTIAQRPTPAETCEPPTPSQIAGIRAAFGDAREPYIETSEAVQRQALILCAEKGWGAALDPQEVAANLQSPNTAVQLAAIEVLGQIGAKSSRYAADLAHLLANPQLRAPQKPAIRGALSAMGPARLAALARSGDEQVRLTALALLANPEGREEYSAEEVATLLRDPDFFPQVVVLSRSSNLSSRVTATNLLRRLSQHDETAAAKLLALLSRPDPLVRAVAFANLRFSPDHGASRAAEVALLLDNGDPEIEKEAVSTLGGMGEKGAVYAQ
jgi:HEAT repeat protein